LTQRNNELSNQVQKLQADNLELSNNYEMLMSKHLSLMAELSESLRVPYTSISGRQITWAWNDMNGELHEWTLTVDGYRGWIEIPKPDKILLLSDDSKTHTVVDFRPYVRTEGFGNVVPDFYQQCADEWEFAQEAFNLVSQLTVYSEDIGEVPRWPVETLTEAGGDCEDLSILFASLLKAAPYPYELSLVYMDSNNPTDPQYPNHVLVQVETSDWSVLVECTNDQGWGFWGQIRGWFFEL